MSVMSAFDWRSEPAYDTINEAESIDIAWEWLRRDGEYHTAYAALTSDQRSRGMADNFRQQWGLSFRS
jgi:Proteobacterial transcriptional regulator-like domain